MNTGDAALLRDLQQQCLADSQENFREIKELLPQVSVKPIESFGGILKALHSLKGNLQAVGFLKFAEFIHGFESGIVELKNKTINLKLTQIAAEDALVLEFLISDCISNTESYVSALLETFNDTEELQKSRMVCLNVLKAWSPTVAITIVETKPQVEQKQNSDQVKDSKVVELKNTSVDKTNEEIKNLKKDAEIDEKKSHVKVSPEVIGVPQEIINTKALYLLCKGRVGNIAIPIADVIEVVRVNQLIKLPTKRIDLHGLMTLRGEVLPIVNIEHGSSEENILNSFAVICGYKNLKFGLLVESTEHVTELNRKDFQIADAATGTKKNDIVTHYQILEDKIVFILDMKRVVAA